jgi:hypothetical protein
VPDPSKRMSRMRFHVNQHDVPELFNRRGA